jgi:hypothetical protein
MFISDNVTLSIAKSLKKREAMHRFPRYARAALPRLHPLRNRAESKCNLNLRTPRGQAPWRGQGCSA